MILQGDLAVATARYRQRGFDEVITPNICSAELFKRQGTPRVFVDDLEIGCPGQEVRIKG